MKVHVRARALGALIVGVAGFGVATAVDAATKTVTKVYITFYGFPDNSCQSEDQHTCNTIAFPEGSFPTRHAFATEGKGTYDDPITYAGAAADDGTGGPVKPGHLIYVPYVRKYFVMEDQCFECTQDWKRNAWHVDLWMGSNTVNGKNKIIKCEDKLTIDDGAPGTATIIVNPPSNLPVDTTKLFTNGSTAGSGTCTAHTYNYN